MKNLLIPVLKVVLVCGAFVAHAQSSDQESSTAAQKVVESAKALIEYQRKVQPQSWNVSLDESMTKENPLVPPSFVLNSGVPPKAPKQQIFSGLWNCQALEVGSEFCRDEPDQHMVAIHYERREGGEVGGQVAAFDAKSTLLADCSSSGEIVITISAPYFAKSEKQLIELEINFDNKPPEPYEFKMVYQDGGVVTENKRLLELLMKDYTSVQVRSLSVINATTDGPQFVVKNFPKAWSVACGWYTGYDAAKGIK